MVNLRQHQFSWAGGRLEKQLLIKSYPLSLPWVFQVLVSFILMVFVEERGRRLRRQRGGDVGAAAAPLHGVGGTGGPGGGRARRCRFEAGKKTGL